MRNYTYRHGWPRPPLLVYGSPAQTEPVRATNFGRSTGSRRSMKAPNCRYRFIRYRLLFVVGLYD